MMEMATLISAKENHSTSNHEQHERRKTTAQAIMSNINTFLHLMLRLLAHFPKTRTDVGPDKHDGRYHSSQEAGQVR